MLQGYWLRTKQAMMLCIDLRTSCLEIGAWNSDNALVLIQSRDESVEPDPRNGRTLRIEIDASRLLQGR